MSETIDAAGVEAWLRAFARAVAERRDELTALDAAIGDADHGINMDRGLQAVLGKLDERAAGDATGEAVGTLLKTVGMTLVSTVGGAAGPLYGTLFLRMATAAGHAPTLTLAEWSTAFAAGVAGVQARGKAEPGDKTMVDTLVPASAALEAAAAGQRGMVATIPLVARKGRASYLGGRSAGTQDPGATSSWLLLEAAAGLAAAAEP